MSVIQPRMGPSKLIRDVAVFKQPAAYSVWLTHDPIDLHPQTFKIQKALPFLRIGCLCLLYFFHRFDLHHVIPSSFARDALPLLRLSGL